MTESASATITAASIDASTNQYTLTLTDTGTTNIGTFWFAWIPLQDYLKTHPITITNPLGWGNTVTGGNPNNGFAIQWVASAGNEIHTGGSLSFSFTSTDTPAEVFGNSVYYPTTSVLTSFVYSGAPFSDLGVQFLITPACFGAGTRILTAHGEVAVEALRIGDHVPSLTGRRFARVRWLGYRSIDCRHHRQPRDVWPVRVQRDAFGPDCPVRDLFLSPDHAIHVGTGKNAVLVPIRYLMNGATIAQMPMDHVTYWHVELDCHAALLAEGLAAESFLDTGNRSAFANGGTVVQLEPELARDIWRRKGYTRLATDGPLVVAQRRMLLARSKKLGHFSSVDPDLYVLAGDCRIDPEIHGPRYIFHLPPGAGLVRLRSRCATPAHLDSETTDERIVGVAIREIMLDGKEIPAGDVRRGSGWHTPETAWQWTAGDATLHCGNATALEVTVALWQRYWVGPADHCTISGTTTAHPAWPSPPRRARSA